MSYLLTSTTTSEELRRILRQGGLEILVEGGPAELSRFLANESLKPGEGLALIWLARAEGDVAEPLPDPISRSIREADPSLLEALKEMVTDGVKENGVFVIDMLDLGVSERMARIIAAGVGVEVSTGIKAVFASAVPSR